MHNKTKGNQGEDLAVDYLQWQGYELLERNYRHGRSEVDIIVLKENLLVFVEVKLRSGNAYGEPETFVSEHQQEKIREAAEEYLYAINWSKNIRFDIITVDAQGKLEHFEDAF
jgi:putative endonuclease